MLGGRATTTAPSHAGHRAMVAAVAAVCTLLRAVECLAVLGPQRCAGTCAEFGHKPSILMALAPYIVVTLHILPLVPAVTC